MLDSRTGRKVLSLFAAQVFCVSLAAQATIEITLKNSFIEKFKNRATIDATYTVVHAHPKPNPPSKDGDLHAAGTAPEIGLATVAEVMNAASEQPALDLIHSAEQSGETIAVRGFWRLWCEHGGDIPFPQFGSIPPITNTNPPHVFEIHPLLKVGDQDVADSLQPIDGFTYKDAADAFQRYENLQSHITVGSGETTITTTMAGFNYVEFAIQLNEDPTHTIADGLTVLASVFDLQGDVLVHNRRMVFAQGTAPFNRVKDLHKGDSLHVVGIPRIDLSLVSYRVTNRTKTPGILDWSLPYEMAIVAVFEDTPELESLAAPASHAQPGAAPAPAARPETEIIGDLLTILNSCREGTSGSGACTFVIGSKVYCGMITKAECSKLSGDWHAGKTCHN